MSTEQRKAHSPLGASGAERWMNCAGSVALLSHLQLPESDESEYASLGTAAHEMASRCLIKDGMDAWELIGEKSLENGIEFDDAMSAAVQDYLDHCRELMALRAPDTQVYIEYPISSPVHKDFYGTMDFAVVTADTLYIRDYKHGEGIAVDAEENPQLMYYAWGLIEKLDWLGPVDLGIVQPRAFHHDGPIRTWQTTGVNISNWVRSKLVPAMVATEFDKDLNPGPWCRFCPAKLVCPVLTALHGAAVKANPGDIVNLSDENIGRSYGYKKAVEFYLKALEDEAFRRLNKGGTIAGIKLVHKKANRVWKPEAKDVMIANFGDDAFNPVELKSPADIDKLGAAAKKLTKEFAYTPTSGLTVALEDDNRPAVKVQSTQEAFKGFTPPPTEDELEIPDFLKRK
jgi:hypothetical protein